MFEPVARLVPLTQRQPLLLNPLALGFDLPLAAGAGLLAGFQCRVLGFESVTGLA